MKKLFTFNQLKDNADTILICFIDFSGGHCHKYNPPTWEGTFELPCDDNFFCSGICDGGGYVEVIYKDGTKEMIHPICPFCGHTDLKHELYSDEECGWKSKHYCLRCENEI